MGDNKFASCSAIKCQKCMKSVYPMEKLEADGCLFHKCCFKCETCSRTLSLSNYSSLEGKYYCKPHLTQLFALKGNYDEGFGREQRKSSWERKAAPPSTTPAKSVAKKIPEPVREPSPEPEPEPEPVAEPEPEAEPVEETPEEPTEEEPTEEEPTEEQTEENEEDSE